MPKKDYGEPTRISERLGAQSLERSVKHEEVEEPALSTSRPESSPASPEPVEPAATTDTEPEEPVTNIDIEPEELVASIESDQYDSAEEVHAQLVATSKPPRNTEQTHHRTTPSPAPETNMSATDNNNNDNATAGGAHDNMASITTILESLMVRLDRMEQAGGRTRSSDREATPDESVFGGKAFRRTGHAARPKFSPWVIQIADKCRCDDETFKVERDRIVMIVSYLDETPSKLVTVASEHAGLVL
ncbi:hypothetical protein E4U49_002046 [Claviceps purpurea]|nr:hypothetical protein E4U49_002046 [Claviceps purpurea]